MITLKNAKLSASIHSKGAELQSVQYNGLEYLWSGDAAFWGKHSPVLFPIVGTLRNDTYFYKGKSWHLPRHGFARDKMFEVNVINDVKAIFTLRDNEDTLKVYPFAFELNLIYELEDNKLKCTYEVKNLLQDDMYFSIGGHPAFAAPLKKELAYTDYYLQFNNDAELKRYKLDDGLIATNTETIVLQDKKLPLTPSLFYEDAIVMKHLKSDVVTLATQKDGHSLQFHFSGFPFLGIWAARDAPFVCIEPWCGIADNVDHNQQLEQKEGIEKLAAGKTWQRSWMVELF